MSETTDNHDNREGAWSGPLGLALIVLVLASGCATYLGYDLEITNESPKTVSTLRQSCSDFGLAVVGQPSADRPVLVVQPQGTMTEGKRETWTVEPTRLDRYFPYEPSPVDDLSKVLLSPVGIPLLLFEGTVAYDKQYRPYLPEFLPGGLFWRNRWVALPGCTLPPMPREVVEAAKRKRAKLPSSSWELLSLPVSAPEGCVPLAEIKKKITTKRVPVTDPRQLNRSREFDEVRKGALAGLPVQFDLGPALTVTVTTDSTGKAELGLKPYLNYLRKDYPWTIKATTEWHDLRAEAAVTCNTTDLGVTWAQPRASFDEQPSLVVELDLTDADGSKVLGPGESAQALLTVRNTGTTTVWGLRLRWESPPGAGQLTVTGDLEPTCERLDPGESWQASIALNAAAEWRWSAPEVRVKATLQAIGMPDQPPATATVVVRSYEPPELKLLDWKWTNGTNQPLAPGDNVTLWIRVQNTGGGEARAVGTRLTSTDTRLALAAPDVRLPLAPGRVRAFTWTLVVPEDWRTAAGEVRLPLDLALVEERPVYGVAPVPVDLRLGARPTGQTPTDDSAAVAAIEQQTLENQALERAKRDAEERGRVVAIEARRAQEQLAVDTQRGQAEVANAQKRKEEAKREADERLRQAEQERQREEERQKRIESERERRLAEQREQAARAQAERQDIRLRSHALLIGVDKYPNDQSITPLQSAVADARLLYQVLTDAETGLFEPRNVRLLVSDAEDETDQPSQKNIVLALDRFRKTLKPEDRLLVFVACHGVASEGRNYLLAQDAIHDPNPRLLPVGVLSLQDHILQRLDECQAGKQMLILDACHSGLDRGKRGLGVKGATFNAEMSTFAERTGRFVLTSTSEEEQAFEDAELGHGIFTYYLAQGLRPRPRGETCWAPADANADGLVNAQEAYEYVRREVQQWSVRRAAELAGAEHVQTPRCQAHDAGGAMELTRTAPAAVSPPAASP